MEVLEKTVDPKIAQDGMHHYGVKPYMDRMS